MIKPKSLSLIIIFCLSYSLSANNILHRADSLYLKRDYSAALFQYKQLLDSDRFLRNDFSLNFKLGICYYLNQEYDQAYEVFSALHGQENLLDEYVDYYQRNKKMSEHILQIPYPCKHCSYYY